MGKENLQKKYEDFTKNYIEHVCATDEQLEYLIKQYSDMDCVLGIHNTEMGFENIFRIGLRNQTYMYRNADDIANTVHCSRLLSVLAMYPNGDGKERGRTAIILKIPKKVFSHEQGIFETLPDGSYGIPTQFIVGAFTDGKVIENPAYEKEYNNPDALICEDPDYENNDWDKPIQVKAFRKVYKKFKSISLRERIARFIERIKRGKQPKLPSADINRSSNESQEYRDSLREEFVVSSEYTKEPTNNENIKQRSDTDIQNDISDDELHDR